MTFYSNSWAKLAVCALIFLSWNVRSSANDPVESDFYYVIPISSFDLDYQKPKFYSHKSTVPFARFVDLEDVWVCTYRGTNYSREFEVAIRTNKPLETINGKIFLPVTNQVELKEFRVSYEVKKATSRRSFYQALERYYQNLVDGEFSGKPWFQHKLEEARLEQGKKAVDPNDRNWRSRNSFDSTFEIFSGSRAIAENIQLDRTLVVRGDSEKSIDVETIPGITIKEYEWAPHLKDKERPKLDRLASVIPHNQHVIFVESAQSFQAALYQVSSLMSPAFDAFSIQSVDNEVIPGYLQQMALDVGEISKQDFADDIQEIAITGSDPYSEIGTDLGVVIQMKNEESARKFATYHMKKIGAKKPLFENPESGFRATEDRVLSAYVFQTGSRLVIANSKFQMQQIKKCMDGKLRDLASLKEFHFFRHRYKLTEDETAFVFMSDAAIRRWCSAKWRIGQSRRLRALALLQRLQASQMANCLALDDGQSIELKVSPNEKKTLGKVMLSRQGVHSSNFGSIRFITPISELDVNMVSHEEEQAYVRWRNGYQRNWSQAFDPIGIQIKLKPKEVFVDLSVIPIIMNSSYQWLSEGKPLTEYAGDLHPNTLIHLIASPGLEDFIASYFDGMKSVEVYVDDDQTFWRDFVDEKEAEKYFNENLQKLPAALVFDFESPEKRDRFLTVVRSFASHAFTSETDLEYKGMKYKRFDLEDGLVIPRQKISFYGDKVDSRLILSFSEKVIKRSIDRQKKPLPSSAKRKLLGDHLSVQVDKRFFRVMQGISSDYYRKTIRNRSWNNLPILQEWKREYPDANPSTIHRSYWGQKLVCTGGGKYKWDPKLSRPYSSAYGNPARPRIPMGTPYPFQDIEVLDAGLGFETDGVRAKIHLKKK